MTEPELLAITSALAVDDLIVVEGYCRNPECPAREVELRIKDRESELERLLAKHGFRCPVCRKPLTVHWARTFREDEHERELDARLSVNAQVYRRDHPETDVVVLARFADDRLPPTVPPIEEQRELGRAIREGRYPQINAMNWEARHLIIAAAIAVEVAEHGTVDLVTLTANLHRKPRQMAFVGGPDYLAHLAQVV